MNPTIITGWIAAILLSVMVGSCLAMPWIRKLDEKGDYGMDVLCKYHRPVVFLTIIAVIVHIAVSLVT